jgi:hypothetical protein
MVYTCPTWDYVAGAHLLKLQHLQNRVLYGIGNFDRHTPVCEMYTALKIPYVYHYITNLCKK